MGNFKEIYDDMTVDAQEVADLIKYELSDVCQKDIRESAEVRENVIRISLNAMDNYDEGPLTSEERRSVCDYVKALYGVSITCM